MRPTLLALVISYLLAVSASPLVKRNAAAPGARSYLQADRVKRNQWDHAKRQNACSAEECPSGNCARNSDGVCIECKDGALPDGMLCGRKLTCSTNQECQTATKDSFAFCSTYDGSGAKACFAPSTNSNGIEAGGRCYSGGNPSGDDNACATGLSCYESFCRCAGNQSIESNGQCIQCQDGSISSDNRCVRADNCTSDADCQSRTSNANAFCSNAPGEGTKRFCFAPSTNDQGTGEGGTCYSGQNPAGDDNACKTGLVCSNAVCTNTKTNPNNCGTDAEDCAEPLTGHGMATCTNGQCGIKCDDGYSQVLDKCVLSATFQARLLPRKRATPSSLCPAGETACPISGSASFLFSANQAVMQGSSKQGWECLDVLSDISSCGGCASKDEGVDCTTLAHAGAVGCEAGQCVIFSCLEGFAVALDGSSCSPVRGPVTSPKRRK